MNKKKRNIEKKLIILFICLFLLLVLVYGKIIKIHLTNRQLDEDAILISESNKEAVFCLDKITLLSSANGIDNSEEKDLQNLNLYQFTDIAFKIKNTDELTNKNTVKRLYIDNIEIKTKANEGNQALDYKNYQYFGKAEKLVSFTPDKIDFNIVYTNEENLNADYDKPTFYTDCSNPITLEYINKDIVTGYKVREDNLVSFDGKILKSAGVELKDIECYIRLKINIENNLSEKYSCWIGFYIPLNDVFKGNSMKEKTFNIESYRFMCNPLI